MGKNRDVIQILLIVLLAMFIPFLLSLSFTYGFNVTKIISTFGIFLLIFGIELASVYIYFVLNTKIYAGRIDKYKPKK